MAVPLLLISSRFPRRAASVTCNDLSAIESIIHANCRLVQMHADVKDTAVRGGHVAVAEADVVEFSSCGPIPGKSEFGAVADYPTCAVGAGGQTDRCRPGRIRARKDACEITSRREFLVGPGSATLYVEQRPVPCVANPRG